MAKKPIKKDSNKSKKAKSLKTNNKKSVSSGKSETKDTGKLTDKQLIFCFEYVKDLNGTLAAIRAGYSKKTAQEQASRLLSYVMVSQKINELKNKRAEKLEITAEMVLTELAAIGFADISQFFDEGYSIKSIAELKDKSKVISSIQVEEFVGEFGKTRNVKFKMHDKIAALEKIAKHIGFFEKDNAQLNAIPKYDLSKLSTEELIKFYELNSKLTNRG